MNKSYLICPNCESSLDAEVQYCPNCGQYQSEKITVGILFRNAVGNFLSADSRLFKSLGPLILSPGKLDKTFISGKRQKYLHPGKFYFFASFMFFFVLSLATDNWEYKLTKGIDRSGSAIVDSLKSAANEVQQNEIKKFNEILDSSKIMDVQGFGDTLEAKVQGVDIEQINILGAKDKSGSSLFTNLSKSKILIDSLREQGHTDEEIASAFGIRDSDPRFKKMLYHKAIRFVEKSGLGMVSIVMRAIPVALFLMIPFFALILRLLFFRKRSYAECLIFSLYQFSFQFLLFALTMFLVVQMKRAEGLFFVALVGSFIYLWVAIKRFFEKGWTLSLLGSWLITLIYSAVVTPFAALLVLTAVFILY